MSCLQNEMLLESIFEEVQEAFPYLDEQNKSRSHKIGLMTYANNYTLEATAWNLIKKNYSTYLNV